MNAFNGHNNSFGDCQLHILQMHTAAAEQIMRRHFSGNIPQSRLEIYRHNRTHVVHTEVLMYYYFAANELDRNGHSVPQYSRDVIAGCKSQLDRQQQSKILKFCRKIRSLVC